MKDKLCLAVDFGTTFSGITFMPLRSATTGQYITTPTQISQWPGQFGESNKVPTCVAYASDNRKPLWGFQAVRPHKHQQGSGVQWMRVKAFKKFLDPKISSTLEWPAPGRDVHEVTRDFLEGMYEHLMSVLAQGGFSEDVVDYHALFTVPAPFSIFAVEAFKRVIQTTGFGRHTFDVSLTEPEAAAIYTITSQQFIMRSPGHFNTSQCFLVCDAGGGTVDISSYSIAELDPVIRVNQTGELDGDLCGSTFIDIAFRRYLRNLLGEATFASLSPSDKDAMEDEFVSNKEHFTNTESSHIRLPHNIDCPGSRGGYLPISPEQMREMFERPVSRTCQLVREHIERCDRKGQYINYIFLVGGFGNSPYLKQRLELAVKQVRPSIEIIKPADAQQSVVLGALHTQLQRTKQEQNPVISTLARAHYGVLVMRPFNPLEHYPQERYIDPLTGEEFARHQIMWYIQKGQKITSNTAEIEKCITRNFEKAPSRWCDTLVRFAGDDAPTRLGPGVEVVTHITSNLSNCPIKDFVRHTKPNGKWCGMGKTKYYEATYNVKMMIGTADIKFEMWYKDVLRSDMLTLRWEELGDPA